MVLFFLSLQRNGKIVYLMKIGQIKKKKIHFPEVPGKFWVEGLKVGR